MDPLRSQAFRTLHGCACANAESRYRVRARRLRGLRRESSPGARQALPLRTALSRALKPDVVVVAEQHHLLNVRRRARSHTAAIPVEGPASPCMGSGGTDTFRLPHADEITRISGALEGEGR